MDPPTVIDRRRGSLRRKGTAYSGPAHSLDGRDRLVHLELCRKLNVEHQVPVCVIFVLLDSTRPVCAPCQTTRRIVEVTNLLIERIVSLWRRIGLSIPSRELHVTHGVRVDPLLDHMPSGVVDIVRDSTGAIYFPHSTPRRVEHHPYALVP